MSKNIYFIGQLGSDAGGWYIGADGKIHRVPGWNPEAMTDLAAAVHVIRYANLVKTAGFGSQIMKEAVGFAQKQLAEYVKDGGIVVISGH
ncbi:hypothetical protein QWZ08_07120 [Ferruginibacter paludis]|uniref:hypothetical protein n=1 Tax=Ferruginibacter paludis TaxID=1310417 RepID=UPI0025B50927|nr:hypothetical protein [Ferruginibacter paludis]MDN3655388.1 hypothetical protein [Ferruginibacter paludis]